MNGEDSHGRGRALLLFLADADHSTPAGVNCKQDARALGAKAQHGDSISPRAGEWPGKFPILDRDPACLTAHRPSCTFLVEETGRLKVLRPNTFGSRLNNKFATHRRSQSMKEF